MRRSQKGTLWGVLALVGLPLTSQPNAATYRALGLEETT
jgi:hypothetical protein